MSKILDTFDKIEDIVGSKYVSNSESIRYSYSRNADLILKGIPDIVVRPNSTDEVAEIIKVANSTKTKIIPRGGGADLTGGAKPIGDGGIVIDLTRMNQVLDVDLKARIVTVECGISWSELCNYLQKIDNGLYTGSTGPASGFGATIGGGLSNNTVGGGGAAMYGAVTEQCVGLEVVLPTGQVIQTGAKANSFMDRAFSRMGLGPDYSGLFLGDVGIHGIKTKASFNLYPIPEFAAFNTFDIKAKDTITPIERVTDVMLKWQHAKIKIHDFYYFPKNFVLNIKQFKIIKSWKTAKVKGGVLFYTTVADSQRELDDNVERLNKIAREAELRKLGPQVENGNIAKWFYEEDGRWQWGHFCFGAMPGLGSFGTCLKAPTDLLPKYLDFFQRWEIKNAQKIAKVGGGATSFLVFGVHPSYIDVTSGLALIPKPKNVEKIYELWKSLIIAQIKELGCMHYWMGEIIGHALVESGALTEEYYNLMISIKKALDPNKIISPNKFHLANHY
ncbi:MAG: FAD-binding oxidoreductase [Candidatus Hodarchaeota archaeon]